MSHIKVYEPYIRARLGTAAHLYKVVVLPAPLAPPVPSLTLPAAASEPAVPCLAPGVVGVGL